MIETLTQLQPEFVYILKWMSTHVPTHAHTCANALTHIHTCACDCPLVYMHRTPMHTHAVAHMGKAAPISSCKHSLLLLFSYGISNHKPLAPTAFPHTSCEHSFTSWLGGRERRMGRCTWAHPLYLSASLHDQQNKGTPDSASTEEWNALPGLGALSYPWNYVFLAK